ncbi:hypothetical protein MMC25_002681 [Agyrium rufum]|nr:hypothetical protein [Agyrium rufum]
MPAPSPLQIATNSLTRLVKEEVSYHTELEQQQARVAKLEKDPGDDQNAEFVLRQEKKAIEETRLIFPELREKIKDAVGALEAQIAKEQEKGMESNVEALTKAKEAIAKAKTAQREIA